MTPTGQMAGYPGSGGGAGTHLGNTWVFFLIVTEVVNFTLAV